MYAFALIFLRKVVIQLLFPLVDRTQVAVVYISPLLNEGAA